MGATGTDNNGGDRLLGDALAPATESLSLCEEGAGCGCRKVAERSQGGGCPEPKTCPPVVGCRLRVTGTAHGGDRLFGGAIAAATKDLSLCWGAAGGGANPGWLGAPRPKTCPSVARGPAGRLVNDGVP